jgi:hypothetical protein
MELAMPEDLITRSRPASLTEAQAVVKVLAKALPIMPSIRDPDAFMEIMAEYLAPYSADVLMESVNRAIECFDYLPSTSKMRRVCEGLIAERNRRLETEQRRLLEEQRRREENERRQKEQDDWRRRCSDFRSTLANSIGDDAPSSEDIEFVMQIVPGLQRAGMSMGWCEFANEDPGACAELCKRLAEIARSERPYSYDEIRRLCTTVKWERAERCAQTPPNGVRVIPDAYQVGIKRNKREHWLKTLNNLVWHLSNSREEAMALLEVIGRALDDWDSLSKADRNTLNRLRGRMRDYKRQHGAQRLA